jgi:hypothetical protein
MSLSTRPDPDLILRRLEDKVRRDHAHCDFIPDLLLAPNDQGQSQISQKGKYRFVDSSGSVTMLQGQWTLKRWYQGSQSVRIFNFEDNGNRLNREWLHLAFPDARAMPSDYPDNILPPFLAKPGHYEGMAHVDIKSAYYSIMSMIGLYPNVIWGKTFAVGDSPLPGYPFADNKIVRNSLYATAFQPRLIYVTRGNIKEVQPKHKLFNPHLVQVTQCILHAVARRARALGAVHWHTDGGLLPKDEAWDFVEWVTAEYGLTLRVKSVGAADVYNQSCYRTCEHEPVNGAIVQQQAFDVLRPTDTIDGHNHDYWLYKYEDWLRGELKHWVRLEGRPGVIFERTGDQATLIRSAAAQAA